jgi:hypothetical protein
MFNRIPAPLRSIPAAIALGLLLAIATRAIADNQTTPQEVNNHGRN